MNKDAILFSDISKQSALAPFISVQTSYRFGKEDERKKVSPFN